MQHLAFARINHSKMHYTEVQKLLVVLFYLLSWVVIANARLPTTRAVRPTTKRTLRNSSIVKLTKSWTNRRQGRLFSRVGRFLSMDKNGSLFGVLHQNEIFEIQSFGPSVVRIKHKQTGMYIAMDSKGKIKGQKNPPRKDTYFYLNHEENAFVSFASYFHRKKNGLQMFLGVKRGGNVKYGRQTRAGQDSMQFLLLNVSYRSKPII